MTVVLLTCSYRGEEFVRVGYYVNSDFADPALRENPPAFVDPSMLTREILESSPRYVPFRQSPWPGSTAQPDCES